MMRVKRNRQPASPLACMTFSEFDLQSSEDVQLTLARAFDAAWQPFIDHEGDGADTVENRRRLATRIVALARSGQTDEAALGDAGLIYMRVMIAASRLSARIREVPSPQLGPQTREAGSNSLNPEAVESMSSALDRCLDELPLQIPDNALQVLSGSILEEAARGERNPDRLHLHAMATLRSRQ